MTLLNSSTLDPKNLSQFEIRQVYNGLDNCVTHESLSAELDLFKNNKNPRPQAEYIYAFERALQAPYMDVMLRGFAIDIAAREVACADLVDRIGRYRFYLDRMAEAVWDKGLNSRSNKMLREFFYGAMRFKEIITSKKGVRKVSLDRTALEKLYETYLYARPFVSHILSIRDLSRQLEVLSTDVDADNRFRSSYNIAGTETGRPSSSENAFGTGGNAQNIAPGLRHVFVADSGYKLVVIDFEQSEARDLGFMIGSLFGDWSYLDACESGDLHTSNARLVWPELPWTGDKTEDKQIAGRNFYRDFSYRDMAKRGGHLCLTSDHEVLTTQGWVPITQKPNRILQWNEKYSNFTEVTSWYDSTYEGDLHQFEGNSVSVMMTADHRVPYKTDQRNAGGIMVRKASEGPGVHMPLGWGYVGGNIDIPARLIAAFMSDGYQASKSRIQFHLKKDRKIRRLRHLCNLYGYQLDTLANDKFSISAEFPKQAGPHMLYWTRECIDDFLDEYKFWDGSIGKTSVSLFSVNKTHMEWIQTLGRIRGIGGSIRKSITTTNFGGQSKTYETQYYSLQQNKRKWASGKSINWTKERVNSIRILCPTVESGFFYIRRNGKISVTGNSNYMGTPPTMASHLKIPQKVAIEFQDRYCRGANAAFPCIPQYWQWAIEQIQTTYKIITPFGRERYFFGDSHNDATAREAIAFVPQSTTADRTNLGFWRTWKHVPKAQLLAQGYDSITFQVLDDEEKEDTIRHVAHLLETPLEDPASGRVFSVPVECKVGYNWGYASSSNPNGLSHFAL